MSADAGTDLEFDGPDPDATDGDITEEIAGMISDELTDRPEPKRSPRCLCLHAKRSHIGGTGLCLVRSCRNPICLIYRPVGELRETKS